MYLSNQQEKENMSDMHKSLFEGISGNILHTLSVLQSCKDMEPLLSQPFVPERDLQQITHNHSD